MRLETFPRSKIDIQESTGIELVRLDLRIPQVREFLVTIHHKKTNETSNTASRRPFFGEKYFQRRLSVTGFYRNIVPQYYLSRSVHLIFSQGIQYRSDRKQQIRISNGPGLILTRSFWSKNNKNIASPFLYRSFFLSIDLCQEPNNVSENYLSFDLSDSRDLKLEGIYCSFFILLKSI